MAMANVTMPLSRDVRGTLVALWALLGLTLLLVRAIARLAPVAWEPIEALALTPLQGVVYAGWVAFNAYAEGYRGFQIKFSPRFVARAMHLSMHRQPLHVALAPLFCMGLFHATRRVLITSWTLLVAIVILIIAVRALPQPWRGIIDGGVVVGLVWGLIATFVQFVGAMFGKAAPGDAALPE